MRRYVVLSVSFALCVTLLACGDAATPTAVPSQTALLRTIAVPKAGKIEVDILSGLPNPTSPMSSANSLTLLEMVRNLPVIETATFDEPLGYRGLVARIYPTSSVPVMIRIFRGAVLYDTGLTKTYYQDDGRRVERWLLATTQTWLDSGLYDVANIDLNR